MIMRLWSKYDVDGHYFRDVESLIGRQCCILQNVFYKASAASSESSHTGPRGKETERQTVVVDLHLF